MAELPQSCVPGTSSDKGASDDGEVAGPAYDQPESSRDRSSSLTGEPLHIRRGTRRPRSTSSGINGNTEGEEIDDSCSDEIEQPRDPSSSFTAETPHKRRRSSSVSRGPSKSNCRHPKNPFELEPEQLAQHLCSSSIFEEADHHTPESFHWSIEQLAELFPASFDEELANSQLGGIEDPHEELAQMAIDEFFSTQEIVPSPCKPAPIVITLSTSSESSGDGDESTSEEEQQVSSDGSEETLSVSPDVDVRSFSEGHSASDVVSDKERAHRGNTSEGRVRRKLFCSDVGKKEPVSEDISEFPLLSRLMGDALGGRSPTPPCIPLHSSPIHEGDPMLPGCSHGSDADLIAHLSPISRQVGTRPLFEATTPSEKRCLE
ncbi:hypothetical protein HPB50_028057 [Hyalomma asiaticum]|nr:hypothetical protein HPB50_028057 [Hyalomma asiaticum]